MNSYRNKRAGGVGETQSERAGSDGGGQGSPVIIHRCQVNQNQDERKAQFNGQGLPLRQSGRYHRRSQIALETAGRYPTIKSDTNKQTQIKDQLIMIRIREPDMSTKSLADVTIQSIFFFVKLPSQSRNNNNKIWLKSNVVLDLGYNPIRFQ